MILRNNFYLNTYSQKIAITINYNTYLFCMNVPTLFIKYLSNTAQSVFQIFKNYIRRLYM